MALRAIGIDWASRRIDDRDRICAKLGYSIGKNMGQRFYVSGSADLMQSDARIAQLVALRRNRSQVEIVFADIDADDRGVARDLEIQELCWYRRRYSRRPPITFFT
jgi:hypothetical protein